MILFINGLYLSSICITFDHQNTQLMLSLKQARNIIEDELIKLEFPENPKELYQPVEYILSLGGKRIRPSLVLLTASIFSDDIKPAIGPALGIEIFHNFTLLHDDLMDNSEIRRGKATVHIKWNPNTSILSGDVMSILAGKYIGKTNTPFLKSALESFNRTAIEVCEGQMMDMDFELRNDVSIEEYIEMIRLKTSVLIAASLELGAITGGATKEHSKNLYDFGLNLGLAFQLQDDLLDSYGDTKTFGKKVGNDILTNKKTYLMITALSNTSDEDHNSLLKLMSQESFIPEEKISQVKNIYDKYDVAVITRNKIDDYFKKAQLNLNTISIPEDKKAVLRQFSSELMGRKH